TRSYPDGDWRAQHGGGRPARRVPAHTERAMTHRGAGAAAAHQVVKVTEVAVQTVRRKQVMMKRNGMMCGLMTSVLSVSMLTGCFGESVVSAGAKVAGGQITTLTVNEIKILNQTILDVLMSQNPGFEGKPLTDVQAHALLAFFIANDFNTLEDLEKLHGIDPS